MSGRFTDFGQVVQAGIAAIGTTLRVKPAIHAVQCDVLPTA
ncbi:MAG TPA: hypothetical protein VFF37_16860 [Streptomyces sp.]|nr:hypothetical protein [Streptomyces sp.]